jgi:hypothetical protein
VRTPEGRAVSEGSMGVDKSQGGDGESMVRVTIVPCGQQ